MDEEVRKEVTLEPSPEKREVGSYVTMVQGNASKRPVEKVHWYIPEHGVEERRERVLRAEKVETAADQMPGLSAMERSGFPPRCNRKAL